MGSSAVCECGDVLTRPKRSGDSTPSVSRACTDEASKLTELEKYQAAQSVAERRIETIKGNTEHRASCITAGCNMKGEIVMSAVEVFSNGEFRVRTSTDADGTVWFVARDIAEALEYKDSSLESMNKLMAIVPEIWSARKRFLVRSANGVKQEREMLCLTEQGVYFFLGRSDKPKALPYQMWIAGEVVPSIRKHGVYMTPQVQEQLIADPDFIIRLAQELKAERIKVQALQEQAVQDRPKVIFAEAVDASSSSILIGNLAKILRQNGVNIGQNRLFAWLRENGYLMNCKGERWNFPTQASIDRGLFEVKTRIINNPDGSTKVTHTTKVTGKGQIYFINQLLKTPVQ